MKDKIHHVRELRFFQKFMVKLIPFLQSQCLNLMRPQLKIKNIVATVLYRFVHEHHMVDCFNVGGSTILKYVNIICDVFTDRIFFCNKYINIPIGNQLRFIIQEFHVLTSIPNICESIDETHIPFGRSSKQKVHTCTKL
jgi:hypothetical protein